MRWALFVAVVGVGMALGSSASASPPANDAEVLAQAKAHFQAGRAAYEAGEYEKAISELEAAEVLRASPMLSYNIGLAWEQLGDGPKAVLHYRRYLEDKPDAENRAEVEQRIATLAPVVAPPIETPVKPPVTPTNTVPPTVTPPPQPVVHCAPGQSITEDTAGHCCWSGQVWSKRRQACAGIPQCPPNLQPNGERCAPLTKLPLIDSDPWATAMPDPRRERPRGVPVVFMAKREDFVYIVSANKQSCATPCSLFLKQGEVKVGVGGAASYRTTVKVDGSATMLVEHRRWGTFIAGAILVGLGTAAAIAATTLLFTLPNSTDSGYDGDIAGVVLATLSASVLLPIGIPLMSKVDENTIKRGRRGGNMAPPPMELSGLSVAPTHDGAATSIRFSF